MRDFGRFFGIGLLFIAAIAVRGEVAAQEVFARTEIPIAQSLFSVTNAAATSARRASVRMAGSTLLIDGTPTGIRAIEHRGEPLVELKKLGFNAVWIAGRPSQQILQEAKMCDIWLIATPPSLSELTQKNPTGFNAMPLTDAIYDKVLFWNLGEGLLKKDLAIYAQWAATLKSVCPDRLLLCLSESGVWDFSRIVDVILFHREPILSSQGLDQYSQWQRITPRLVRPDTTIWGGIQTQPDPRLIAQWQLFGVSAGETASLTYEQIQLLTHLALGAGCHGLLFSSQTPLLGNDPDTEYRRRVLELVNCELMLVEEWFSRGDAVDDVASLTAGGIKMALLKTPRSRLLVPIAHQRQTQYDLGPAAPGEVRYIVPGVPDTYTAYQLLPGDIRALRSTRIAGGMEVVLEESTAHSLIFFTEEPSVLTAATQRSRELGQRMAQLAYELALRRVDNFEKTYAQLRQMQAARAIPTVDRLPVITLTEQESLIASTRRWIGVCSDFYASRQNAAAYLQAEKATRGVRLVECDTRQEATRYDLNSAMVPTAVSFTTLPSYLTWRNRAQGGARDANRLTTGDFENAISWQNAGWSIEEHKLNGVITRAQITPRAARSGSGGIELFVGESEPKAFPAILETAPIWINSPPIPVRLGEVLCITGWINIAEPLVGSTDGILIMDSLGGETLSLRVSQTSGWQEFAAYRVSPIDGQIKIIVAMTGGGRIALDDFAVTGVAYAANEPPAVSESPNVPYWQRLNPIQYLPNRPNFPSLQNMPNPWQREK